MLTFLHTLHPTPILLDLGAVQIHWYGLLICLAILAGLSVAQFLGKRVGIKPEQLLDLAFWLIIFAIIGARLYDCLLDWSYYAANPWDVLKIWQGGLAIHGALIGGAAVLLYFCWKKQSDFWLYASIIVPGIALGQAIGRWGNYFNQELFGRPTNLPWGIPIDIVHRPLQFVNNLYFQPTFLYESLGDLLIFALLFCCANNLKTPAKTPQSSARDCDGEAKTTEKTTTPRRSLLGVSAEGLRRLLADEKIKQKFIFLSYLIAYSALRFSLEFIKVDPTPAAFGLRAPQWVSLLIDVSAIGYLIYSLIAKTKDNGLKSS